MTPRTRSKPVSTRLWKRFAFILLFFVLISVIFSWIRIFFRAREVQQLLQEKHTRLESLQERQQQLEKKIETATASFELERRAREELLLQASGEAVWRLQE